MPLLDLWMKSPDQLRKRQIQQLIAFAGAGRLLDDSPCSAEFRSFLATVPSARLSTYSEPCLTQSFPDSVLALQDLINEIGARLGASVTHGRYRGSAEHAGFDGLWTFPSGHSIVVRAFSQTRSRKGPPPGIDRSSHEPRGSLKIDFTPEGPVIFIVWPFQRSMHGTRRRCSTL